MNPLEEKLLAFGLSETEAKIYLSILNRPHQTVWQLSQALHLPRTTIYDQLQKMNAKGLITKSVKYKSQDFSAAPIEVLQHVIEDHQTKVQTLSQDFIFIKNHLPPTQSLAQQTDVKYFHGRQGLQQMIWNSLEAKKEIVGYSVYGRADVVGVKFMRDWLSQFQSLSLRDRVIINPFPRTLKIIADRVKAGIHQQTLKDIRVLSQKTIYVSGDTMIYNSVFAVCWWQEGEIVGIEIHNPELVKTQTTIFNTLWSQAKSIKPFLK